MLKIKRALISVSDKTAIVDFARVLASFGAEILSTGGTAKTLREAGVAVTDVSDHTGFPEILGGRVKTLHPKIHAGLLAVRDDAGHMRTVKEHGIGLIDMVVVNLYPFEKVTTGPGVALEEAVENIDIGGPAMLRSAAKNYRSVAAVCDPAFYDRLAQELKANSGCLSEQTRGALAVEVFSRTSSYDGAIADYLSSKIKTPGQPQDAFPEVLALRFRKVSALRYGENPHQRAALYKDAAPAASLVSARRLHGKELSFNNYLDLNAAFEMVRGFEGPCACVIKHTNPTGVAQDKDLKSAFKKAIATDPLSAFGGVIGLNRRLDTATAGAIAKSGFMECVIAPGYETGALKILQGRKNLRLLEVSFEREESMASFDFKKIDGGLLVQEEDKKDFRAEALKFVTNKRPTKKDLEALFFAWKVVRRVKSNAIVLARGTRTVGVGMGETSRVDAVFMAIRRAQERSRGAVLASDAFFPKADNIVLAKKAGIRAVIQPGGSVADEEVIRAADRAGIAMVFTGFRHFKH